EAMFALEASGPIGAALGRQGREFFRRHYAWPVIERKYLETFDRLAREQPTSPRGEALPGWWARRARTVPAARRVLEQAPRGPVLKSS
ncbi:MAG: hypothetical protein AB7L71_10535, partial [Vicinamibacterales bacterium]